MKSKTIRRLSVALLAGTASFLCVVIMMTGCGSAKNPPQPQGAVNGSIRIGANEYAKEIVIVPQGTQTLVSMTDDTHWNTFYSGKWDCFKGAFLTGRAVTLNPFVMSQYEVTQELYAAVLAGDAESNNGPSAFADNPPVGENQEKRPVETVTWYDAVYFCNALTQVAMSKSDCVYAIGNIVRDPATKHITSADVKMNMKKKGYRLPTEAEWEFAARGGDPKAAAWNDAFAGKASAGGKKIHDDAENLVDTNLAMAGWYYYNSNSDKTTRKTHETGLKLPNSLGLYDMSGNVWEWCWDIWGDISSDEMVTDPRGNESGRNRVSRGGAWSYYACSCVVSYRDFVDPSCSYHYLGFRVCRSLR